jgi:SnoaL-like polyketide cyclase
MRADTRSRGEWLKHQGRRAYRAIETGDVSDAAEYIAPTWHNAEAVAEPPAARQPGPAGFACTVRWLRRAYSDIRFVEHEAVAEGDLVISRVIMHGVQTGPLVLQESTAVRVVPPTGRSFAVDHVHVTRFDAQGRAEFHAAIRDDLGQLIQLGHFPPSAAELWRQFVWAASGRTAAARREFLQDAPPAA